MMNSGKTEEYLMRIMNILYQSLEYLYKKLINSFKTLYKYDFTKQQNLEKIIQNERLNAEYFLNQKLRDFKQVHRKILQPVDYFQLVNQLMPEISQQNTESEVFMNYEEQQELSNLIEEYLQEKKELEQLERKYQNLQNQKIEQALSSFLDICKSQNQQQIQENIQLKNEVLKLVEMNKIDTLEANTEKV